MACGGPYESVLDGRRVNDGDAQLIHDSFGPAATWHYPGDLPISKIWQGRDAIVGDFPGGMGLTLL
ncbi:hypothetical protein J4573_02490 [Actinomadura barringtoniae]|uniref:Uncharacterized protein n=1 Tax=Actinomadura barringtoniae TaxID=1427535 RepID=A0A939P630_9ACTN|nr:hypothetical protein [Actinomadura barringtoniae]MBO2445948.1 hypothetical protein [Actinomadura barringtoniae]